jgi:hypothetical protein
MPRRRKGNIKRPSADLLTNPQIGAVFLTGGAFGTMPATGANMIGNSTYVDDSQTNMSEILETMAKKTSERRK